MLKTLNTAHGGKMSVVRVLSGQIGDSTTLSSPEREAGRVAGTFKLMGQHTEKRGPATVGETVALAKLDYAPKLGVNAWAYLRRQQRRQWAAAHLGVRLAGCTFRRGVHMHEPTLGVVQRGRHDEAVDQPGVDALQ